MSQANVELVRQGYELFAAGEYEAVAALMAPEAEVGDSGGLALPGSAAGSREGPDGFLRSAEEGPEAFEGYTVEPEQFIDAGDAIVVPVRISGRGRTSGVPLDTRLVHLWVLRDGQVIRGEVYRSTEEALQAARP
jgi:uncharacterized protein